VRVGSSQLKLQAAARFVERIGAMLVSAGTVRAGTDRRQLNTFVAKILNEGYQRGIRTERLLGMYVLLRVADGIDPYKTPGYLAILGSPALQEDDKAHLLQMLRLGEISIQRA
jgi:hypothetical protein